MSPLPTTLTPEQQALRASGIGSSEIAAVVGLNPWMRPIDVWQSKMGRCHEPEDTAALERGIYLEQGIGAWYANRTSRVLEHPGTLQHPDRWICLATPDAISHGLEGANDRRVLEIKAPDWRSAPHWGEEGSQDIPAYYVPQVQWEMGAAQIPRADIAALIDGRLQVYTVPFHEKLFAGLCELAERFWAKHVLTGEAPGPDGSASYSRFLERIYPAIKSRSGLIPAPSEAGPLVQEYQRLTAILDRADEQRTKVRQQLEMMIGDEGGLVGSWGKIYWRQGSERTKIDYQAIVEQLEVAKVDPDLIKKHTHVREGTRPFRAYFVASEVA
jgi:putative phage-type endonuclease